MFKLEIHTDNDAFQPNPRIEVSRILHELEQAILRGETRKRGALRDINGNTIGAYRFDADE